MGLVLWVQFQCIIYECLISLQEEVPIGEAKVRAVFGAGSGKVAGCMVTEGKLVKSCGVRVMRGTMAVHVGLIDSLRRVKEAVKEVKCCVPPQHAPFILKCP